MNIIFYLYKIVKLVQLHLKDFCYYIIRSSKIIYVLIHIEFITLEKLTLQEDCYEV